MEDFNEWLKKEFGSSLSCGFYKDLPVIHHKDLNRTIAKKCTIKEVSQNGKIDGADITIKVLT